METAPSIDAAIDFFDAHTVEPGVDVSPKVVGSAIESVSIIDLGDRRVVRCYSGREVVLTYEERKGDKE